jgi:hypothetical protein
LKRDKNEPRKKWAKFKEQYKINLADIRDAVFLCDLSGVLLKFTLPSPV